MDNLINNTVTAINNGEHPEAPGVPGWTVIIPWVTVDSIAQNHSTSDVTESEDDKANTDSKMIRNADGSVPRICLARWVKNYWIEITPRQVITPRRDDLNVPVHRHGLSKRVTQPERSTSSCYDRRWNRGRGT